MYPSDHVAKRSEILGLLSFTSFNDLLLRFDEVGKQAQAIFSIKL